jgi:hypothetical protein
MRKRPAGRASAAPRSATAADCPRKTGWQVRSSVADAVKQAVEAGAAESQNAFVERALIRELRELRRQRVYESYAKASADPNFMKEMRETTEAFDPFAGEGLPGGRG